MIVVFGILWILFDRLRRQLFNQIQNNTAEAAVQVNPTELDNFQQFLKNIDDDSECIKIILVRKRNSNSSNKRYRNTSKSDRNMAGRGFGRGRGIQYHHLMGNASYRAPGGANTNSDSNTSVQYQQPSPSFARPPFGSVMMPSNVSTGQEIPAHFMVSSDKSTPNNSTAAEYKEDFPPLDREIQRTSPQKNVGNSSKWAESVLQKVDGKMSCHEMRKILQELEEAWNDCKDKNHTPVLRLMRHKFSQSKHPHELVIFIVEKCKDFHVAKTSTFAYHIMKEFYSWCKESMPSVEISAEEKLRALDMCLRYHSVLLPLGVMAFKLDDGNTDVLVPVIKEYVNKQKYKEAALSAGKLGLQDHFTLDEIVFPLLLQDKVNLIQEYLVGNERQQQLVVQMLDELCDNKLDLDTYIRAHAPNVTDVKRHKLHRKTLSKLAVRLSKLYDIPQESCPNISNCRGQGAVKYLLYKRYIEKSMGAGSWEEMITSAVGDNQYLKEQLVEHLFCYNETLEAAKWAVHYNLTDDVIPPAVAIQRQKMSESNDPEPVAEPESVDDWDAECVTETEIQAMYYKLSLPMDHITMVDTKKLYDSCLTQLSKPGTVLGIDSEWKPSFGNTTQRIAVIQIAVIDHVYLIDVTTLLKCLTDLDWLRLVTLFSDRSVLKLGYGFGSDLQMFVKTFPFMKERLFEIQRIVDLEKLAQKVIDKVVNLLPDTCDDDEDDQGLEDNDSGVNIKFTRQEERGLSELVKQSLGKPLNKSEQMSDWEKRPLRTPQILYAALDAHVLLEVYDVLVKQAKAQNMKIDLEPPISMKWMKPSKREKLKAKAKGCKQKKMKKQLPTAEELKQASLTRAPIPPSEFKVVVDSMLGGLGRRLRSCGVDVKLLDNEQDHADCIQISVRENRIALTSGTPFQMINAHVKPGMAYCVQSNNSQEQLMEVLQHFKIRVSQNDIFSRCQKCNGNEYLKIPTNDLYKIYRSKSSMPSASVDHCELTSGDVHCGINVGNLTVASSGAAVNLDSVPESRYDVVDLFYVCVTCGKVFWEGSHFDNIVKQFSHVLDMNPGTVDESSDEDEDDLKLN